MYINLNTFGTVFIWVVIGALAGALASFLIRGRSRGPVWDALTGLAGAVLGGFLVRLLNIQLNMGQIVFDVSDFIVAFVGAVILLFLIRVLFRR